MQTVLEKLQLTNEKNILIQGLPSSVEKPFARINYAKSITPLLRTRKIDFALVFAVNIKQLEAIIEEVVPALGSGSRLWIAIPRLTSKIYSELSRDYDWEILSRFGYTGNSQVALDSVWNAICFECSNPKKPSRKTSGKLVEVA